MPIRALTRWFLLGVAALTLAACGSPAQGPTPHTDASVRRAIEEANLSMMRASRHHDAAAIAARFAPDAVLLMEGQQPIYGRQEIGNVYARFLQGMNVEDSSITTLEVTVLGEYAIEMGTNSVTMRPRGQSRSSIRPGKYLTIWKRQPDGNWRVWRDSPTLNIQS